MGHADDPSVTKATLPGGALVRAKVHVYPLKIREAHLDTFGHVNNAVYLMIFEEARWEQMDQFGMGMDYVRSTQVGPTVLEVKLRFLRELKLRSQVQVKTRTASMRSLVFTLEQWIEDEAGARCCEAEITMGFLDLKERRLRRMPADWRRVLALEGED